MIEIVEIVSQQKQQAVAMYMGIVPEPIKSDLKEFRERKNPVEFFDSLDLARQEALANHLLKITNIETSLPIL